MTIDNASDILFSDIKIVQGEELDEAAQVLPLVLQAHKESYFVDVPFELDVYLSLLSYAQSRKGYYGAFTVTYKDEPIGFALYMLRPMLGNRKYWVTNIHSIYLRGDFRSTEVGSMAWHRMFSTIKMWSLARQARGVTITANLGIATEAIDSAARAVGATYMGGNYFWRM